MEPKILIPRNIINSEGKMAYSEGFQAWNILRLKKELFNEFPELKEKRSSFSYKLAFYRNSEEFEKFMKDIIKNKKEIMPILMWLYKDVRRD